ncbi:hypothetical protein AQUSIP_11170 [Aquicella siphonis]|uniref:Uncharacterized protein n=1 Tax=Aquicella siphonis TaxID=254247 RepID=A0A5E4PFQ3_9COXI|nr:hypothetical protein [Aquicella siphonis]VVC75820.1 hypothetical protein AQUSIP_11170 [Aquicella siphonis]
MFTAFRTPITTIEKVQLNTTPYKYQKLEQLKQKLLSLEQSGDLSEENLISLLNYCDSILDDSQFTYIQIGFFGLRTSRCENVTRELYSFVKHNMIGIFLDKLRASCDSQSLESKINKTQFTELSECIKSRNYTLAQKIFNLITASVVICGQFPDQCLKSIKSWLERKLSLQIELIPDRKVYAPVRWPSLEIRSSQTVYDLNGIRELMMKCGDNEVMSFTYAIDLHGNVVFSIGANTSYHINLCGGEKVCGAGEVFLKKSSQGICVELINNKSGLYLPRTEFMRPLKYWFARHEFIIDHACLHDERDHLIQGFQELRMMK